MNSLTIEQENANYRPSFGVRYLCYRSLFRILTFNAQISLFITSIFHSLWLIGMKQILRLIQ